MEFNGSYRNAISRKEARKLLDIPEDKKVISVLAL